MSIEGGTTTRRRTQQSQRFHIIVHWAVPEPFPLLFIVQDSQLDSGSGSYSVRFPTRLMATFYSIANVTFASQPGICETTEGVRSYSGYVHMPPYTVDEEGESQNYPINM